jgi:hypothetical protein
LRRPTASERRYVRDVGCHPQRFIARRFIVVRRPGIHEMVTVERLPVGVKDKGQSKREKPRNR